MSSFKQECRKFQPNIFNKSKCASCFRQREEHSAEALDLNRACRKVSKCGYLFVAPDWDFSNPLNRTKRWQRRWFVLYDDGELTYSVDDLPATIPQGVIDMNRVLEVSEAEEVTGNQFALAITSPDRATFVKGTSREESRWWKDVLSVFPRAHKQSGRYKRNATFPGIKASSSVLQQSRAALGRTSSPSLGQSFDNRSHAQRIWSHSSVSESFSVGRPSSAPTLGGDDDDSFSSKDSTAVTREKKPSPPPSPLYHSTPMSSLPPSTRLLSDEHKENTPPYMDTTSSYIEDYEDNPPTSESPPTQDKVMLGLQRPPRTRRTAKREARGLGNARSEVSQQQQQQMYITDLEESKREEKLKDIADSLTRPRLNTSSLSYLNKDNGVKPTRDSDTSLDQQEDQQQEVPHLRHHSRHITFDDVTDASLKGQVRGDPDGGCGLEGDSNRFQLNVDTQRVELPAEDILHIKKGFLLKLSPTQDWNRHWFVLEGSGLKFFRDQSGEENGILDGIVDMSLVKNVQEKEVGRNHGFVVTTWDDKTYTFSAVTSNIRSSWVQAMRNAANLKVSDSKDSLLTLGEKLEREMKNSKDKAPNSSFVSLETESGVSTTPPTMSSSLAALGRSFLSSEDEFKTASESSFFKELSRDNITSHADRMSSRPTSRGTTSSHNRSKSSPPTSRRGTRDDYPQLNSLSSASSRLQQLNNSSSSSRLSDGLSVQSIQDLETRLTPEKDSNGTLNSTTGEGMLVELLETQVESLKAKLEQTQITELKNQIAKQEEEIKEKNKTISKIESIRKQFQEERREWEERISSEEKKVKDLKSSESKHGEIVRRLTRTFQESEAKVSSLTQELNRVKNLSRSSEVNSSRAENAELKRQVSELTSEIARLKEALKSEKSEAYKWKDLVKELRSLLDGRNVDMEMKREEMASLREKLKETQSELDATADRLHRGIEENESLCGRLRELERQSRSQAAAAAAAAIKVRRGSSTLSLSNSKKNLPRLDSLSDLTNLDLNFDPEEMERECLVEEFKDLRMRFEKAVGEIFALKKEIRNNENLQDDIELTNQRLRNELKTQERDFEAQNQLMGTRLQDLTNKLNNSEKQVRTLKQKLSRSESKERRRTLSLKGKESFSLSKDLESKLTHLEAMVNTLLNETEADSESPKSLLSLPETRRSKSFEESNRRAASAKLRRKSLDGQTTNDTIKAVIRVNELEEKVLSLSKRDPRTVSSNTSLSSCGTSQSTADASANSLILTGSSKLKSSPVMSPLRSPATPRRSSVSRSSTKSPSERTSSSRVTRSDSESKNLKEKVKSLEKVLTTVEAKTLEENHREEMEALQKQHQEEIDRLRDQVKYDPPTRDSDDELTELKRRLCLLEEGYEAQIAALKKQYQEALGSQSDVCEENIRQRYQIEIEHLRELCEKGLTAMETSHRRLVAEMEAKHHREMEQLQAEKEEALAEETQATLAALDAMRKAHEAEVQKEVAKFKEEFLRRAENGLEGEATHSRLHEEQLAEVRREILALSEKYSSKCLEMAAKEQKAESLLRQLTELKAQTKSLEDRNRFLKQKLNGHLNQIQGKPEKTPAELQRQYECEMALKDEEIAWLNQLLQRSKSHETDLGTLCGRLGHFLKTDNYFGSDYVSAVRDRFQRQMYTTLRGLEGSRQSGSNISNQNGKHVGKTSREVTRSPSCPGLSSSRFSPSLREGSRTGGLMGSTLFSPLMGVVAQRKKVFESPPAGKTKC